MWHAIFIFNILLYTFLPIPAFANMEVPQKILQSHQNISECIITSAQLYNVPPAIIAGLHASDPGQPGKEYKSPGGNILLGLMKVNSLEIDNLSKFWNLSKEETWTLIKNDACANVSFAAWKFRSFMDTSPDLVEAIKLYGNYVGQEPSIFYTKVHSMMKKKGLIRNLSSAEKNSQRWLLLTYSEITLIKKPIPQPDLKSCLADMDKKQYMNSRVRIQCLEYNSGALYEYGKIIRPKWIEGIPKSIQLGNIAPWVE